MRHPDSRGPTLRPADVADLAELVRLTRAFSDEDGFSTSDAGADADLRARFALLLDARPLTPARPTPTGSAR